MADMKDKCTIIGPTVKIRGKVKSDEDLLIRGRIDAAIASTKLVHVDTEGVVKADIEAESVIVSGVVLGNITAASRVELMGTARIVGDIASPLMVINDGARLKGKIDMPGVDRAMEERYVEVAKPAVQPAAAAAGKPAANRGPAVTTPLEVGAMAMEAGRPGDALGVPKPIAGMKPVAGGTRSVGIEPIRANQELPKRPLPGVDPPKALAEAKPPIDMDGIIDALGVEPEVEEIEMSDDHELLSVYDLDGQSETTAVGQNPINAKPAKN